MFQGQTKAIDWAFPKLVGVDADRSNNCLVLQVSNRQKAHVLQVADVEILGAALEAAVAGRPGLQEQTSTPVLPPPPGPSDGLAVRRGLPGAVSASGQRSKIAASQPSPKCST